MSSNIFASLLAPNTRNQPQPQYVEPAFIPQIRTATSQYQPTPNMYPIAAPQFTQYSNSPLKSNFTNNLQCSSQSVRPMTSTTSKPIRHSTQPVAIVRSQSPPVRSPSPIRQVVSTINSPIQQYTVGPQRTLEGQIIGQSLFQGTTGQTLQRSREIQPTGQNLHGQLTGQALLQGGVLAPKHQSHSGTTQVVSQGQVEHTPQIKASQP